MRVLLIEDNASLATLVTGGLERAGFSVDELSTAADAKTVLGTISYAAIILDLGLPDEDGTMLLRDIRRRRVATPVLVLTARTSLDDRVNALHDGADDYLTKPFAMEELAARLNALLRRPGDFLGRQYSSGNLSLDVLSRQVTIAGLPCAFSRRETALLEEFLQRPKKVVQKSRFEHLLFDDAGGAGSNAVEVYVHRLRKALEKAGASVEIHTVRGVGYLMAEKRSDVAPSRH